MKIVEAVWEKRNIGQHAFEVTLTQEDTLQDFIEADELITRQGATYVAVKTPVAMPEFIFGLPDLGYIMVETAFHMMLKKQTYRVPPYLERLDRNVTVREVTNQEDAERILDEIKEGVIITDRISLDPTFTPELAANRFVNWSRDLLEGNTLVEMSISGKPFGFGMFQGVDEKVAYLNFSGVFNAYKDKGLGLLMLKKFFEVVWNKGFETMQWTIVSNNPRVLRANLAFGADIESLNYTFVSHKEGNKKQDE